MSLPLTKKDLIRFTPERDNAPTYLLGVPTLAGRANFRRKIEEEGASFISDAALLDTLRDGVREHVTDNQKEEVLGLIDEFEACAPLEILPELISKIKDIEKQIRDVYPTYREAVAARGYYLSIMPLVAAKCFLRGIEGGDVKFQSKAGTVTDECMDALPEEDVKAIGWEAFQLLTPTAAQIKNSGSPLQSAANPEILTAEK